MSVEQPWMKHDNGIYSSEISELTYPQRQSFQHPYKPNVTMYLSQFTPQKDQENEITHWIYKNGNDTFEIFND
jgi:hypothetical protein